MPFLQGNADFGDHCPIATVWCTSPSKKCRTGDTLISVRAPVGEMNKADKDYAIGRGLAALSPRNIHEDFFHYGMLRWRRALLRAGQGTTYDAVTSRHFRQVLVPKPCDPDEQKAIGEIMRSLESALEHLKAELAAARRLKTALMQQLFTKGIPGRHKRFKETRIGRIPEAWDVVHLGSLLCMTQYGLSESFGTQGKHQILRMTNIEEGVVHTRDPVYIDLDEKTYEAYRLKVGDILFNRTNSLELVGRVGVVREHMDAVFASYLVRLNAIEEKVDPFFLNHCLNSYGVKCRYRRFATPAVGQANINPRNLKQTLIALPKKESGEQEEVVRLLAQCDATIDALVTKQDTLLHLKKSLLQNLLTGKVRVTTGATV